MGDFLSINNKLALPYGQTPVAGPGPIVATGAGAVPGAQIHQFRGGAASWFGTQILGLLITFCTFGVCYAFAVVLVERWPGNLARPQLTEIQLDTLLLPGSSTPGWCPGERVQPPASPLPCIRPISIRCCH